MRQIELPFSKPPGPDEIKQALARCFRLSKNAVIKVLDPSWSLPDTARGETQASLTCVVTKRSLDARGKPVYRYQMDIYSDSETYTPYQLPQYRDVHDATPVIVIGAGPAGMFAALKLLTLGLKPIVLERGKDVHSRKKDMALLSREGKLDPDSNYCFGEGGAGAFSDGKLYTRSSKRGDNREVLEQLARFGAPASILIDSHPHIGSDKLPLVVENIRHCIEEHGGQYRFNAKVVAIKAAEGGHNVITASGQCYHAPAVIMATGHSARDFYSMLQASGYRLESKGFALGVRVEHPQSLINDARYHGKWRPGLPAADYSFVKQVDGRGVFSFCMCPGGILVPSSTEPETVVLNGMSNSERNGRWANSGVVVSIEPGDTGDLSLLDFQLNVEREMYRYVRGIAPDAHPFAAPAQRMMDFCQGRMSSNLLETSYHPGVVSAPLHRLLPPVVASRLRKVFPLVDIPGYYTNDALLLGVESRTSSPVRIVRDPESLSCAPGLYPCGEGAGYSGGIVSSAIDGIRCALAAASYVLK